MRGGNGNGLMTAEKRRKLLRFNKLNGLGEIRDY